MFFETLFKCIFMRLYKLTSLILFFDSYFLFIHFNFRNYVIIFKVVLTTCDPNNLSQCVKVSIVKNKGNNPVRQMPMSL